MLVYFQQYTIIVKSEKIFLKGADCTLVIFISLNTVILKNIISLSIYRKFLNARHFQSSFDYLLMDFYPYVFLNEYPHLSTLPPKNSMTTHQYHNADKKTHLYQNDYINNALIKFLIIF